MDKKLILLSGGFDSVIALLYELTVMPREGIVAVFIRYHLRSDARERETAQRVAGKLGVDFYVHDGRSYDIGKKAFLQTRVMLLYIAPYLALSEGASTIVWAGEAGNTRGTVEECLTREEERNELLQEVKQQYRDNGWKLTIEIPFGEVRKMEIMRRHGYLFEQFSVDPLFDTYSCFSIVDATHECGRCWKCFRKYALLRTTMPRERVRTRFTYDPMSSKRNVEKARVMLEIFENNPSVTEEQAPNFYTLYDLRDIAEVIYEDTGVDVRSRKTVLTTS